jgi:hypothetical protein
MTAVCILWALAGVLYLVVKGIGTWEDIQMGIYSALGDPYRPVDEAEAILREAA